MLYEWDDASEPVHEYHYMKDDWKDPPQKQSTRKRADLRINARDVGHRTIVDLNVGAVKAEPVFLDLDTEESAHVVEFYVPWCPHCQVFKSHYVDVAQEVTRRTIGFPVSFHAVSCSLYQEVCRSYNIDGFPIVLGYGLGESIEDRGWELNKEGTTMTAESIAERLDITLAHEPKKKVKAHISIDSDDARAYQRGVEALADAVVQEKKLRHEFKSTLNERYHNAAVSLAFVLKTSVFLKRDAQLDGRRASALKDFLELVDWASPQHWHIRTSMVQDLLHRMDDIVTDEALLMDIVEDHQSLRLEHGLWGGVQVERGRVQPGDREPRIATMDTDEILWRNSQWTEACTHSERGLGYTCGLWDLFHLLTVGASLPSHQLYGFRSGYLTGSQHVAEIIKRFITSFLACDVCRWNFVSSFDNCAHDHCHRLAPVMSPLASNGTQNKELALWLWETHNAVNTRLMKESAEREDREVTEQERLAASFPTREMCSDCWFDDQMKRHDKDAVFAFLRNWYWYVLSSQWEL